MRSMILPISGPLLCFGGSGDRRGAFDSDQFGPDAMPVLWAEIPSTHSLTEGDFDGGPESHQLVCGNAIRPPLVDAWWLDLEKPGYRGRPTEDIDDFGAGRCIHAPMIGMPNNHVKACLIKFELGLPNMSTLADRMQAAFQRREEMPRARGERISQAGLARACKISAPSVNAWFSGDTKKLEGENLIHAAAYLRVNAEWLATGAGKMEAYVPGGSTHEPAKDPTNITQRPTQSHYAEPKQYKGEAQVIANARVSGDGDFVAEELDVERGGWVPSFGDAPTYALRIKGDALLPVYDDEIFLIVQPGRQLANGEPVVIYWKDGRCGIRRLMLQRAESLVVLPILGGMQQSIERSDILEAHYVFGTAGASNWHPPQPGGGEEDIVMTPPAYGNLFGGKSQFGGLDELPEQGKKRGAK